MQAIRSKTWLVALSTAFLAGCGAYPTATTQSMNNYSTTSTVAQNLPPTLPPGVYAKSISLDPATAAGRVGESFRFNIAIKCSDGKIYTDARLAVWSLTNPQLGTVDQNGVLVPSASGTVKIVAMMGTLTAQATVQVDEARFAWQQMIAVSGSDLRAVKMVGPSEAWAGGDKGTMLRYTNGAWHREPTFNHPDVDIKGIGFANSNTGWVVGSRSNDTMPYLAKWNGNGWNGENIPVTDGRLTAISVLNDHDVWAVGQEGNGDSLILHYDGFNWKAMQTPAKGRLNAIQMLSPKLGWAVGKANGLSTMPLIFKYVDGSWTEKNLWADRGTFKLGSTQELTGIKMVSETQGYAVGISNIPFLKARGVFLSYDPKRDGWSPGQYDAKTPDLPQVPLHAIDMISGTEGWALGEVRQPDFTLARNPTSIFGNLMANAGGVLKMDTNYFSGSVTGSFYAIDLLPQGQGFVVGQNGFILQRTYDWRGTSTGYNSSASGYGSTSGTGYGSTSPNAAITFGPGGTTVPGTQVVNHY
jgi:hypothetical protein